MSTAGAHAEAVTNAIVRLVDRIVEDELERRSPDPCGIRVGVEKVTPRDELKNALEAALKGKP